MVLRKNFFFTCKLQPTNPKSLFYCKPAVFFDRLANRLETLAFDNNVLATEVSLASSMGVCLRIVFIAPV